MNVARTRDEFRKARRALAGPVGFVPTMGALHEGHRSLVRISRARAASTVVSIFVNPLQFGPSEDLDRYPRPLEADLAACAEDGVDLVFAPTPSEIYPHPPRVTVTAGDVGTVLCGASRPGHFDGVLTVVAKLFHLVAPDVAVFGEKDAQQLALIGRMVRDLDFPVDLVAAPTVREADGLALSSRNAYLSPEERRSALALSRALAAAAAAAPDGPAAALRAAREVLDAAPGVRLDYAELVDPETFGPPPEPVRRGLLAIAAWVGSTRLIDNATIGFT